eukprot:jgi/Mesen1/9791/ME000007S09852
MPRGRPTAIKTSVQSWLDSASSCCRAELQLVEADSVALFIEEQFVQVTIPSWYKGADAASEALAGLGSDGESFIVTLPCGTTDSRLERHINRANEKLERLRAGPGALAEALDIVLAAVQLCHLAGAGAGTHHEAGIDSDAGSDGSGRSGSRRSGSREGEGEACEYDGWSDGGSSLGVAGPIDDLECYDLALGERDIAERELDDRRGSFLHEEAMAAARECVRLLQSGGGGAGGEGEARDETLQWCVVRADPRRLLVQLQLDVGGIMDDIRPALALGLSAETPVKVDLCFPREQYSAAHQGSIRPESIEVRQDLEIPRQPRSEAAAAAVGEMEVDQEQEEEEEEEEEEEGEGEEMKAARASNFHYTSYGCSVLLPEMISQFFESHASARKRKHPSMHSQGATAAEEKELLASGGGGGGGGHGHNAATPSAATSTARARLARWRPPPAGTHALGGRGAREEVALQWASLEEDRSAPGGNLVVALLLFVANKLRTQAARCVVCGDALPDTSGGRLRPCVKDICLYKFEDLGLGAAVLHEVRESLELVELDITLASAAAASDRDVFEPFPSFLLRDKELRGRAGWFNRGPGAAAGAIATVGAAARAAAGRGNGDAKRAQQSRENKHVALVAYALRLLPSPARMAACAREDDLRRVIARFWSRQLTLHCSAACLVHSALSPPDAPRQGLHTQLQRLLPYYVLRFVLSTNRLTLRMLEEDRGERLASVRDTLAQLAVLSNSPEQEAQFAALRRQRGSFFAFHGSPSANWFSILRNGLRSMSNTRFMSTGAAHGAGIYLSDHLSTSLGYAQRSDSNLGLGRYKAGWAIVAICECISGATLSRQGSIMVVDPAREAEVLIRYLLVFGPGGGTGTAGAAIAGTRLGGQDLTAHVEGLRATWREEIRRQQAQRKIERRRVMQQRAAEAAEEDAAAELAAAVTAAAAKPVEFEDAEAELSGLEMCGGHGVGLPVHATVQATQAISSGKHLSSLPQGGFRVSVPDEHNMYTWRVELRPSLFQDSPLSDDLLQLARARRVPEVPVVLEARFSGGFPFDPPFMRVVAPRFAFHTGHVTVGGSICMELLTQSGWSPACDFESVLVQIIADMVAGGARLDPSSSSAAHGPAFEYSLAEAKSAYLRVAQSHGWQASVKV